MCFVFMLCVTCMLPSVAQDQAIADSLISVLESRETKDDTTHLRLLVWITQNQNDPKLKLEYAERLMELARDLENLEYLHHAYLHQGQSYRLMGDFDIAIYALFKALDYAERCDFQKGVAGANTALGDVYSIIGDNANAVNFYNKSIGYLRSNDSTLLANTLLNLGDEYYMAKMYDLALNCFEESRSIYEMLGSDRAGLGYNLGNIGLVYAELDQLALAEENVRSSIKILAELDDHYGRAIFLTYLSEIYQRKGLLEEARNLADSSMAISKRYGLKTEIRDNSLRLADIYAMNADFETAYKFHQQYVKLKDSIANNDIFTRIENLKSAFDLAKKQSEVDLLKVEKQNQQIVITAIVIVSLVLTVLAIVVFSYYRSKARINRILEDQKSVLESLNRTKDKYFSIISHDLRGSVSSFFGISRMIKYLISEGKSKQLLELADDVDQSVERLSNLLDNLLTWAMQQQGQIPTDPEKHSVKQMVDETIDTLANLSAGKSIEVTSAIPQSLYIWVDKNTIMTVLRNLLSNALKFTNEGGKVKVSAALKDGFVTIEVKDSGIGMDGETASKLFNHHETKSTYGTAGERGLGLGLQLVDEFVSLNNGKVSVKSEEGKGTTFFITLPSG
ncbi:MAG: tetratricopeptide repeat protein [Cyclobacteriaceae bacterium]